MLGQTFVLEAVIQFWVGTGEQEIAEAGGGWKSSSPGSLECPSLALGELVLGNFLCQGWLMVSAAGQTEVPSTQSCSLQ